MSNETHDEDSLESIEAFLAKRDSSEVSSVPKKIEDVPTMDERELKPIKPKKETPKNDEFNEYDYSDDKELDDKEW